MTISRYAQITSDYLRQLTLLLTLKLLAKVTYELKCGKASDINGLTAEHTLRAHPVLPTSHFEGKLF